MNFKKFIYPTYTFFIIVCFSVGIENTFAATISGYVANTSGQPIANTTVTLQKYGYYDSGCGSSYQSTAPTNDQGYYEFPTIDITGSYYLFAGGPGTSLGKLWWSSGVQSPECDTAAQIIISDSSQVSDGKNFQLSPEGVITGQVTVDGNPIADIAITANIVDNPCWWSNTTARAYTNSEGNYTLEGLSASDYIIQTDSSSSYQPYIQEKWAQTGSVQDCDLATPVTIISGQTVPGIDFSLELGATLTGTVYDQTTTNPIPYPSDIRVLDASSSDSACGYYGFKPYYPETSDNGQYTIYGIPPGEYFIQHVGDWCSQGYLDEWWAEGGSVEDCSLAEKIVIDTPGEAIIGKDFHLSTGSTITGLVTDETTSEVIPYVNIRIRTVTGSACDNWWGPNIIDELVTTDETGRYTISSLLPGDYYVSLDNFREATSYIDEWWAEGGSVEECNQADTVSILTLGELRENIDLQLRRGATISGTVIDAETSLPIPSAEVTVQSDYWSACNSGSIYRTVMADVNGDYTIGGLTEGNYLLIAGKYDTEYLDEYWSIDGDAYAYDVYDLVTVTQVGENITGKDFQLDKGVLVTGQIFDDSGQPYGDGSFTVYSVDQFNPCAPDYNFDFHDWPDSDGHYEAYVVPGAYYVIRADPWDDNLISEFFDPNSANGTAYDCSQTTPIFISTAGIVANFFYEEGATISGKVTDSNGLPVADYNLQAKFQPPQASACDTLNIKGYASTNSNGDFTLIGLPAGSYFLKGYSDGWYNSSGPQFFLDTWYAENSGTLDCSSANSVTVGNTEQRTGVDMTVGYGGRIEGTVYDIISGMPTEQFAYIYLLEEDPCVSSSEPSLIDVVDNCDEGIYKSDVVPPGEYYLSINTDYSSSIFDGFWGFPETVTDCSFARKVRVEAGKIRENTDFYRILSRGDINGDGNIDLIDVIFHLKINTGLTPYPVELDMGDTNVDGKINMVDVIQTINSVLEN